MLLDKGNEREESRMTPSFWRERLDTYRSCARKREGQCASVCHVSVNVILYKLTLYHIAKEETFNE